MTERVINNQGIKILLERMDSNPDEFVQGAPDLPLPPKWRNIIVDIAERVGTMGINVKETHRIPDYTPLPFLSDDEVLAVYEKLNSIRGNLFTKQIMSTLLNEDKLKDWGSELSSPTGITQAQLLANTKKAVHDHARLLALKEYAKQKAQTKGLI